MRKLLSAASVFAFSWGFLFLSAPPVKADQYLCVAEAAAGFSYDENIKKWKSTTFRTDNKYIIAPVKREGYAYKISKIGDTNPFSSCKEGFNKSGFLFCEGVGDFKFNKNNGRYLFIYSFGYYSVHPELGKILPGMESDKTSDTPYMEIGKCPPF